jgi:hypothetical protein
MLVCKILDRKNLISPFFREMKHNLLNRITKLAKCTESVYPFRMENMETSERGMYLELIRKVIMAHREVIVSWLLSSISYDYDTAIFKDKEVATLFG